MPSTEADRGHEACSAYVEQVCACAQAKGKPAPATAPAGTEQASPADDQTLRKAGTPERPYNDLAADLAEQCYMAPAKVSSLAAVLEVDRTTRDMKERAATQRTARRIIASCIAGQTALLGKGCRLPPTATQPAP